MNMKKNEKSYTKAMVLYPDSLDYDYNRIIDYIEKNWLQYGYIKHKAENDETKEHTHLLVHFPNKRYDNAVAKELGISENYVVRCNLVPYLRYLIHLDDEEKIQYSADDVQGPLKDKLKEILNKSNNSEEQQVAIIFSFISECNEYLTLHSLTQFVIANGCYSAFRRNFSLFNNLLLEHNKFV